MKIFQEAQEKKYAIGQFNVSNMEQLKAVVQAAKGRPFLIGTSEGECGFMGKKQIVALVKSWGQGVLHLDHGSSFEVAKEAIEAGYDSIHFDGSKLPFNENMEITKKVVDYAHEKGIKNVEGELGYLRGKSVIQEEVEIKEEDLTDVEQAAEFVEKTGIDSLAVVIGNIHGVFKSGKNPHLFLDRLKEIQSKTKAFLVLHGGSGIPEEDIKEAVNFGVVKINVNTELRIAYTEALKESLKSGKITPYKIMAPVVEKVQKVVEEKIKLFGL